MWTDTNTVRTTTIEIRNETNGLVFCESRQYKVDLLGTNLVYDVIGQGASALTNSCSYYYSGSSSGCLERIEFATGEWEIYKYETNQLKTNILTAFLDQSPTNDPALCKSTQYQYGTNAIPGAGDSGFINPFEPRATIQCVLGQEVGRSYVVWKKREEKRNIQCLHPGATWDNVSNLVRITRWYTNGPNKNRIWIIENPDGILTVHNYQIGANRTNIVMIGVPDSLKTNVVDGIKTVTVLGPVGQLNSRTEIDIASGITNAHEIYSEYDAYNRPRKVLYWDGTSTWNEYGCCGTITETNREGTGFSRFRDGLGREASVQNAALNIATTNVFDAHGRLLRTTRIGSDGSKITNAIHTYDTAGRHLSSKDALGNITTYSEVVTNNRVIRTITYPDSSTRIEEFCRDGQLAKITGTAVHPIRFHYGVIQDEGGWQRYTAEIKLDGNGNDTAEVMTNFFDMLGRNYKSFYGDGAVRRSYWNTKGQLDKVMDADGVTTVYGYNARGEVEYTATDMDRDGVMDFAETDRIRLSTDCVTNKTVGGNTFNVRRKMSYAWSTNNSAVSNVTAVLETTTDRLRSWSSEYGLTNEIRTAYTGSGNRHVTNTAADGSFSVSHFQHRQLKSVTWKDSAGNQLRQTTYAYDSHGRERTVTDARNGTTTYARDNADRVISVTTPAPGSGGKQQTTSYAHDHAGRITRTALPDGAGVTNVYSKRGELLTNHGARTYPVAYEYDAQGRKTNMTTWKNFAARTGGASTSWKFNSRGFMTNKVYADGTGPSYTYTPAGRMRTRTWARGVTTTYETNAAGDVIATLYSDGTTSNVTNYLDRLGRKTNVVDGAGSRFLQYAESGLLLMETNATGLLALISVNYTYDAFNRRATVFVRSNATTLFTHSYAYDGASRLTNTSDGTYSATYSYVANSPLVSQVTFRSNTVTRMTTRKKYDFLSRLVSTSSAPSADSVTGLEYDYNDTNHRTRVIHTDGSYWLYEYDKLGQLISARRYWSDGTLVAGQQFEYTYDDIGNRTQMKEGGDENGGTLRSASYSANSLNQYTQRGVPGALDIMGIAHATAAVMVNGQSTYRRGEYYRKELSIDNTTAAVWQSVTNQAILSAETNTTAGNLLLLKTPENFGFDADGNQTNNGRAIMIWDAENRLIRSEASSSVPAPARKRVVYAYDDTGRRISRQEFDWDSVLASWKILPFSSSIFALDAWNCLAELDSTNKTVLKRFLWGSRVTGAFVEEGGVGSLVAVTDGAGTSFCSYDGSGNIVGTISGATGQRSASYEYTPFGQLLRSTGSSARANPFRFSTKHADDAAELVYYGYRYYSPVHGNWLNRDPIGETGGRNVYGFVENSPVNNYDKDGRLTVTRVGTQTPQCEEVDIRWSFELDNEPPCPGYFILENWLFQDTYGCCYLGPRIGATPIAHFWEAFEVDSASGQPPYPRKIRLEDVFGSTDRAWVQVRKTKGEDGTVGDVRTGAVRGTLKFFCKDVTGDLGGIARSGLWQVGGHRLSGLLPSTNFEPEWWNKAPLEGPAERGLDFDWKCCDGFPEVWQINPYP